MTRLFASVVLLAVFIGCSSQKDCAMCDAPSSGLLRHVVFFKFADGTTPQKVREVEAAFAKLPEQIPQIAGYEWGTNESPEPHAKGYTHCFLVTFKTAADRDTYLTHAAHTKFVEIAGPAIGEVHVLDYISRK